jgi:uncharacterized membrane protein
MKYKINKFIDIFINEKYKLLHIGLVFLIITVSLLIRIHISSNTTLWVDERLTVKWATQEWLGVFTGSNHSGFTFILTKLFITLFGFEKIIVRLPSILAGCFLLLFLYKICRLLKLSPLFSIYIVSLFSLNPLFLIRATDARHYAILSSLVLLDILIIHRIQNNPKNKKNWIYLGLISFLALYTHSFAAIYIVIIFCYLLFYILSSIRKQIPEWKKVLFYYFMCALLVQVIWIIYWDGIVILLTTNKNVTVSKDSLQLIHLKKLLNKFTIPILFTYTHSVKTELFILTLGSIFFIKGIKTNKIKLLLVLLFWVPFLFFILMKASHFKSSKYILPSLPIYYILFLFILIQSAIFCYKKNKLIGITCIFLFIFVLGYKCYNYPNGARMNDFYYEGFVNYFKKNFQQDTKVLIFPHLGFKFGYYTGIKKISKLKHYTKINNNYNYIVFEQRIWLKKKYYMKKNGKIIITKNRKYKQQKRFFELIKSKFGITKQEYLNIPYLNIPRTIYQKAPKGKLITKDMIKK